jgi:hypothetical protein
MMMGRCLCLCLYRCARSECECERKGGRLVVAASGFAALGEQTAFSVGVESNYAGFVVEYGSTVQYSLNFLKLNSRRARRSDTDNPDRTDLSQMTLTAQQKGKGRLVPQESARCAKFSSFPSPSPTSSSPSSAHSSSESESDEDSSEDEDEDEDEEDDVSQEYLDSLLEKARRSIASKAIGKTVAHKGDVLEEDVIGLDDPESELKCVPSPPPFFSLSFPFGPVLISFKEPSSTGPGHFTRFLHHARENT